MNFKIIIAGYCEDFTEYEQLIEYKNIYELKIGYLSKEEIKELMMDADVLILPYRQVTQSGPLMMAFHFGVIPLASDLYGFQELIINGQNGFLFKNNSVYDLVEVMQKILVMSGADRDIIKKNLKRFVSENYDPVKITNLYKSMFDSVIRTK
jgi:glycosyltransferase involved in cell wall biosynthesis